eukprot:jgi/Botrbrau1/10729/Bobra.357_1s0030.1
MWTSTAANVTALLRIVTCVKHCPNLVVKSKNFRGPTHSDAAGIHGICHFAIATSQNATYKMVKWVDPWRPGLGPCMRSHCMGLHEILLHAGHYGVLHAALQLGDRFHGTP